MMTGEEKIRRERLASLKHRGIDPYPAVTERTHTSADVVRDFAALESAGTVVAIAGRIRALRQMGGLTFIRLEDGTGTMQVVLKEDEIGNEQYTTFIDHADVGDFFGFSGSVFVTMKGEQSVLATTWTILSKALSPLPDKWHGLQDVETRYRHRELDLISNPEVRRRFVLRSKLVSSMRKFLDAQGFLEVETPMLQPIPGGASARPFITHHNALDADLYLRIAPELYLKRLVVGGFEKIYEIGRCFRNEGIDYAHNPEFTMLELYFAYATKDEFVSLMENLVLTSIQETFGTLSLPYGERTLEFATPWKRVTFRQAIIDACGIDIDQVKTTEAVQGAAAAASIMVDFNGCVGLGEYYDALYKKTARANIVQPTWVFDYPIELKPLTKAHPDDPSKSSSVQLVVQGAEIINAYYYELNDPIDQRARFEEQQSLRDSGSEEAQWMDEAFLNALEHAMPPTSGLGIGIDRLIAFLTDAPNLKEVILFPTLKSEQPKQTAVIKKEVDVFGAIKARLEKLGLAYETKHHAPTAEAGDEAMGYDPALRPHHAGAKAIIVKGKKTKNFFHFVLPDDCKLDQKKAAVVIGEKFSFASAEEVLQVTGCVPGSVPPFGSVLGLQTHMDRRLKDNDEIFFNAGQLTDSIRIKCEDFITTESPVEVDCADDTV